MLERGNGDEHALTAHVQRTSAKRLARTLSLALRRMQHVQTSRAFGRWVAFWQLLRRLEDLCLDLAEAREWLLAGRGQEAVLQRLMEAELEAAGLNQERDACSSIAGTSRVPGMGWSTTMGRAPG